MTRLGGARLSRVWGRSPSLHLQQAASMLELPSLTFYPFLPHAPSEAVPGAPALYQA